MRNFVMGAAFLAALLPATGAFAWCGSGYNYNCNINDPSYNNNNSNTFKPTNTNVQGQQQGQAQGQGQIQKAYGGNAAQSQSLSNTNTNENNNTATASNSGNNQNTSFNDVHQAPAFAGGLAMSGQCTGEGFNAALSLVGGGGAIGYASVEKNCRKDIHIALGLSSGQPEVVAQAKKDWFAMDADLFGHANADPTLPQTGSTSETPAAIAPEQTADATPAECVGKNSKTIWYSQNCPAY